MRKMVTWQDAEDLLVEAFELIGALPDREAGWLAPGKGRKCSGWPAIVREVNAGDYGDAHAIGAERPVRRRIGKREMATIERVLLAPDALAMAIPEQHRALVGRAVAMKRWSAGGFRWEDVRAAMGGRAAGVPCGDALRKRYDRAIARVAAEMDRRERRAA